MNLEPSTSGFIAILIIWRSDPLQYWGVLNLRFLHTSGQDAQRRFVSSLQCSLCQLGPCGQGQDLACSDILLDTAGCTSTPRGIPLERSQLIGN